MLRILHLPWPVKHFNRPHDQGNHGTACHGLAGQFRAIVTVETEFRKLLTNKISNKAAAAAAASLYLKAFLGLNFGSS